MTLIQRTRQSCVASLAAGLRHQIWCQAVCNRMCISSPIYLPRISWMQPALGLDRLAWYAARYRLRQASVCERVRQPAATNISSETQGVAIAWREHCQVSAVRVGHLGSHYNVCCALSWSWSPQVLPTPSSGHSLPLQTMTDTHNSRPLCQPSTIPQHAVRGDAAGVALPLVVPSGGLAGVYISNPSGWVNLTEFVGGA